VPGFGGGGQFDDLEHAGQHHGGIETGDTRVAGEFIGKRDVKTPAAISFIVGVAVAHNWLTPFFSSRTNNLLQQERFGLPCDISAHILPVLRKPSCDE
jgi:hypothetical protein